MGKDDDHSGAHFDWLLESRSNNQLSTLALYKLIEDNDLVLSRNVIYQTRAQDLAAIAFSLWRAVFLSDLKGEVGGQLADVRRFLQSLIAHNAILYQTDFNTREWTFRYYLENAIYRLRQLSERSALLPLFMDRLDITATYTKEDWTQAQGGLNEAIMNFAETISDT